MRCEMPILTRCCFCLPLRHGLLVWAYFKQICSFLFLLYMIMELDLVIANNGVYVVPTLIASLFIVYVPIDIIFHTLFIISAHTKEYRKMRVFYRYSIFIICLSVVLFFLMLGIAIFCSFESIFFALFLFYFILPAMGFVLVYIFLQWYLIVLVRSEFLKLKNNSQFEFVNHAAEEKCTADINFSKGINV